MRKSSKVISLVLSGLMATSCFNIAAVAASAATAGSEETGAWMNAQQRLEAGHQVVFFKYPASAWGSETKIKYNGKKHTTNVFCNYYAIYGNENPVKSKSWEAPSTSTYKDSSDSELYYFDITESGQGEMEEGKAYGILFSTKHDNGAVSYQTCDMYLDTTCIGDIWRVDEPAETRENTANSQKQDYLARSDSGVSVPLRKVSTLCAYIDGAAPANIPASLEMANALQTYLPNPVNEPSFTWSKIAPVLDSFGTTPQDVYDMYVEKFGALHDSPDAVHYEHVDGADDLKADGTLKDVYRYTAITTTTVEDGVEQTKTVKYPDFDLVRERLNLASEPEVTNIDTVAATISGDVTATEAMPTVTGGDDTYSVAAAWDPEVETADYDTTYTLTVTFTPVEGYAFTADTTATLGNGLFDSVTLTEAGTIVATKAYTTEPQPPTPITDVNVQTEKVFSPGEALPTAEDFTCDGEGFTVSNIAITPADETFAYEGVYTLTFDVAAEEGYVLNEETSVGMTFPTESTATFDTQTALNEGVISATITITMPEEPVTVIVAGSEAEIFGTSWDATNEDNLMTKQADGTYTKEYTVEKAYDAVQLKAVVNGSAWIGDLTDNNVTFNLKEAGTFTVIYHPAVDEDPAYVEVTGDIVEFITTFEYDTVYAVGNGEGFWLNGASWDPAYAANEMTEIADDVWEITFENVPDGFERQIKFAIDGAWTHNFGGAFEASGVETVADYNGDNITFDTDDVCTVKAQLDLREFDFTTKEGAKFTLTIEYDEEEETTEPVEETTEAVEETTEAVEETTEAVEETTEAVEETTEAVEETTEAVEETTAPVEDTVLVAGSEAEIFGTSWDGTNEDNLMTKQADGTYTKEYTVAKAYTAVQLKAVVNGAEWIGDLTGNNVTFNLTDAGTFTVIYHPAVDEDPAYVEVTGDIVEFITEFTYDTVYAVGNGEGFWLNGASWDPAYAANEMTEIADDVWEITFENVPDGFERQIKFAIDGAWTHNFGGAFEDSGVETAAVYNGDNITFDTDDVCTVKVQLDLTEFDFTTKEGAKFTLTIEYDEAEEVGIMGDVNGDGQVTIEDATLIQRRGIELEQFTEDQDKLADVNGDGRVSILDVTCVQKYLAEYTEGIGNTGAMLMSDGTIVPANN